MAPVAKATMNSVQVKTRTRPIRSDNIPKKSPPTKEPNMEIVEINPPAKFEICKEAMMDDIAKEMKS